MHNDEPGHFGMKVIGTSWSNRGLEFDEGARVRGDVYALREMRIGNLGYNRKNNDPHDSTVVYGNLWGGDIALIKNEKGSSSNKVYIFSRSADPDLDLDAANGDVTALDTYKKRIVNEEWNGEYDLLETASLSNDNAFVQGAIKILSGGTPPGDSTLVKIDFPQINYDTLRDIAQSEDHYFSTPQALYDWMRGDPSRYTPDANNDTTFKLYGKVFFVEGDAPNDPVIFGDPEFNSRSKYDVRACFVPLGGLEVEESRYDHIAPDSFPAIVSQGYLDFEEREDIEPDAPVYVQGLIYVEGDGDDDPYGNNNVGQVHLHHRYEDDRITVKGAVIADYPHDCVKVTVEYDPKVQWTGWLFEADDAKMQIVSWRELKRG